MATLKRRLHRKNASGSYDIVYLQTTSDLVLMSDGSTTLTSKISSMDSALATKQDAASAINTGNIASQSVNYANSSNYANGAGNADTVDGYHVNLDPGSWGIKPVIASTGDLVAGSTGLNTGYIYLVYE